MIRMYQTGLQCLTENESYGEKLNLTTGSIHDEYLIDSEIIE